MALRRGAPGRYEGDPTPLVPTPRCVPRSDSHEMPQPLTCNTSQGLSFSDTAPPPPRHYPGHGATCQNALFPAENTSRNGEGATTGVRQVQQLLRPVAVVMPALLKGSASQPGQERSRPMTPSSRPTVHTRLTHPSAQSISTSPLTLPTSTKNITVMFPAVPSGSSIPANVNVMSPAGPSRNSTPKAEALAVAGPKVGETSLVQQGGGQLGDVLAELSRLEKECAVLTRKNAALNRKLTLFWELFQDKAKLRVVLRRLDVEAPKSL